MTTGITTYLAAEHIVQNFGYGTFFIVAIILIAYYSLQEYLEKRRNKKQTEKYLKQLNIISSEHSFTPASIPEEVLSNIYKIAGYKLDLIEELQMLQRTPQLWKQIFLSDILPKIIQGGINNQVVQSKKFL